MTNGNRNDDHCAVHGGDVAPINYYRSEHLSDVGGTGYLAATVIGPDGVEYLILADCVHIGDPNVRFNPDCPDAPHERVGPLAESWRRRIHGDPRCYPDQPEAPR